METDDILAIFLDRGGHTIFGVYFYRMLYRRKQECLNIRYPCDSKETEFGSFMIK